jgi:hypothetical protein
LRVEITLKRVVIALGSVIFTSIRVKIKIVKSHSACGNCTLRVEINLGSVEITLERVVITFLRVVIILVSVIITLIRVKITLCE